jgi:hypothetical protein
MRGRDDPKHRSPLRLTSTEQREVARVTTFDDAERAFPPPADATPDVLAAMAVNALRYDGRRLAAALGLSEKAGEALITEPGALSARQRALLAQFLEFSYPESSVRRERALAIAERLRETASR